MVVAGPMAALQAYLMEMQWDAGALDVRPDVQLNIGYPWPYLQKQLQEELTMQRARRIQELEHCFPMMRRPDWTTYHRVMKELKGVSKAAIDAWTQGSLRTHTHGGRAVCPLCNVPVTMKHLIWECSYHEKPLPPEWKRLIAANEDVMLWARGMIDSPDYRPQVGVDSLQATGVLEDGWPTRISPSQRFGIGVKATCRDGRLQRYAVAVTVGQWKDGSRQLDGARAALTPGKPSESRAWVFGCWLALQAILGRQQINIPHRAGWQTLQQGAKSVLVADLWRNLDEAEWRRLRALHVPAKMLKGDGGDQRAWMQFQAAQQCAQQRAEQETPREMLRQLADADQWHYKVYETAAERIGTLIQDKSHYMHDKITQVNPVIKLKERAPKGRLEIMQRLAQRKQAAGADGLHSWMLKGRGLQCRACGMHIKASSTHAKISKKDGAPCASTRSKTLLQQMKDLVDLSAPLPDDQPGHRWVLRAHNFSCQRCWSRVPIRCGKEALTALTETDCRFGEIHEGELQLRTRVHTSHKLSRHGDWVACTRCNKHVKIKMTMSRNGCNSNVL